MEASFKPEAEPAPEPASPQQTEGHFALEICFLTFVGLVVLAAFIKAFSYQIVSSRTPFVIMTPLLILIAAHGYRLYRERAGKHTRRWLVESFTGRQPLVRKIAIVNAWFVGFLALVVLIGHYLAAAVFMFVLIGVLAKERLVLALAVSVITTAVLYALFEYGFGIHLYPGLIYRTLAGYRGI